jgi:drug/metabolite transporter (DMT)-like permease
MNVKSPDHLTYIAFGVVVIFGGLNSIGIRYIVAELPPFWGATLRFVPASALLFLLVLVQRLPLPKGRALLGALIYGVLEFGIAFALAFWSLQTISAGLGQVVLALTPLLTLMFAILHRQEGFRWQALAGGLLAIGGIALIFADQLSGEVTLLPLIAIVLSAVCFAEAGVIIKGFPQSHPITTNAIGMAAGAVVLFTVSLIWGEPRLLPTLPVTWLAYLYLILIGSCLAFILFLYVLKRWTASAASYIFVLMPFVTILVATWIGQETVTLVFLVGGALVLLGIYVGALRKPKQSMEVAPEPGTDKYVSVSAGDVPVAQLENVQVEGED